MGLQKQTLKAFKWSMFGTIISQGGAFGVSIILARLLSPDEFGLLGMAMVFVAISRGLIDVGFSSAIIQKQKVTQEQLSTVFFINLLLSILLYLSFFALAPLIANFYGEPILKRMTRVISLIFIFNGLGQVQQGLFIKQLQYNIITKISVVVVILSGSTAIAASYQGWGVWALVVQQLTIALFTSIFLWHFSSWRPSLQFNLKSIKPLFSYGIKLFISSVMDSAYRQIDRLIIGKTFSKTSLGLYTRALSFQSIVNTISVGGLQVLFPAFSKKQKDIKFLRVLFYKIFSIVVLVSLLMSAILWLVAKPLFLFLLGEQWLIAADYFKILMLIGYGFPVSAILVNLIKALGRSDIFLKLEIYKKVITFPTFIIAVYYGIEPFLWSRVILSNVAIILNIFFVARLLNTTTFSYISILLKKMILVIIITVLVWLLPVEQFEVYFQIIVLGIVFGILSMLMLFFTQRNLLNYLYKMLLNK